MTGEYFLLIGPFRLFAGLYADRGSLSLLYSTPSQYQSIQAILHVQFWHLQVDERIIEILQPSVRPLTLVWFSPPVPFRRLIIELVSSDDCQASWR